MFGLLRFLVAFAVAALFMPAVASAAPLAAPAPPSASASLLKPLTLTRLADMDFGNLAVAGAGTAVIDAVTDTMATTGAVTRAGGSPRAALFRGVAQGSSVVIIRIPTRSVTLTRAGGSETMILDNFTLDGQSKRTMAQAGVFDFKVGGTLRVAAGQVEGLYSGTFDVTIQYP